MDTPYTIPRHIHVDEALKLRDNCAKWHCHNKRDDAHAFAEDYWNLYLRWDDIAMGDTWDDAGYGDVMVDTWEDYVLTMQRSDRS